MFFRIYFRLSGLEGFLARNHKSSEVSRAKSRRFPYGAHGARVFCGI